MNLLKYTKCNPYEGFYGVPQCCSFNSFTLPNGNTDCEATDNYKVPFIYYVITCRGGGGSENANFGIIFSTKNMLM